MTNYSLKNNTLQTSFRCCPLCAEPKSYRLHELNYRLFDDSPLEKEIHLVACISCGFVYYDTHRNAADYDMFYQNHYLVSGYQTRENHPAEIAYLERRVKLLEEAHLDKGVRVVDVGCGPGQLLKRLQAHGFSDLTGVELCQEHVDILQKQGIQSIYGSAMELPLTGGAVDCFIYKNFIEHIFDLHGTITTLKRHIRPGGLVLIEVPDTSLYNAFQDYSPLNYFIIEHINHFDQHHMQRLFAEHGFSVIREGTEMLDIAERYPVPIMHTLFRYEGDGADLFVNHDAQYQLAETVTDWFKIEKTFNHQALSKLASTQKPVYVWGLSYRTMLKMGMSDLKFCNIVGYVDNDPRKQQKKIATHNIITSDILAHLDNRSAVVIGVGPSSTQMKAHLDNIGFKGEVIVLH